MPFSSVLGAQSVVRPGVCTFATRPAAPYDGQVVYLTDTDQTLVWDGAAWTVLAPVSAGRNAIINGAFNIWQRGTSIPLPLGGGGYVADRWWYYNNGFTSSITRELCGSTLPQFRHCARIQRTAGQTGTAAMVLFSPQETVNSLRFAGKSATVSFYARASSGASRANLMDMSIITGTGTDQSNFGGGAYTGASQIAYINPTLTTSWQRFSVTGTVVSSATEIGLQIGFIPTGTAGASDWFEITGIQLEEGSVATPFEFEDFGVTLAKCQRYYEKTYDLATSVGTATQVGMVGNDVSSSANHSNYIITRFQYKVPKRSAPAITVYDAGGNSGKATVFNVGAAGTNNVTVTTDFVGENSFRAYLLGTTSAGFTIHYTASAEL